MVKGFGTHAQRVGDEAVEDRHGRFAALEQGFAGWSQSQLLPPAISRVPCAHNRAARLEVGGERDDEARPYAHRLRKLQCHNDSDAE